MGIGTIGIVIRHSSFVYRLSSIVYRLSSIVYRLLCIKSNQVTPNKLFQLQRLTKNDQRLTTNNKTSKIYL